jgi:hypothetical protein
VSSPEAQAVELAARWRKWRAGDDNVRPGAVMPGHLLALEAALKERDERIAELEREGRCQKWINRAQLAEVEVKRLRGALMRAKKYVCQTQPAESDRLEVCRLVCAALANDESGEA